MFLKSFEQNLEIPSLEFCSEVKPGVLLSQSLALNPGSQPIGKLQIAILLTIILVEGVECTTSFTLPLTLLLILSFG